MFKNPFENPMQKREGQTGGDEQTLREKVTEARKEQSRMTPEEREAERLDYMEELKHGKKITLTPEEQKARKEREERANRLKESRE